MIYHITKIYLCQCFWLFYINISKLLNKKGQSFQIAQVVQLCLQGRQNIPHELPAVIAVRHVGPMLEAEEVKQLVEFFRFRPRDESGGFDPRTAFLVIHDLDSVVGVIHKRFSAFHVLPAVDGSECGEKAQVQQFVRKLAFHLASPCGRHLADYTSTGLCS